MSCIFLSNQNDENVYAACFFEGRAPINTIPYLCDTGSCILIYSQNPFTIKIKMKITIHWGANIDLKLFNESIFCWIWNICRELTPYFLLVGSLLHNLVFNRDRVAECLNEQRDIGLST